MASSSCCLAAMIVICLLTGRCSSYTWVVTNSKGVATWVDGTSYNDIYAKPGDYLYFQWRGQQQHGVVQVTYDGYDKCDFEKGSIAVLGQRSAAGNVSVALKSAGQTYYACPVLKHCAYGHQKLKVFTSD